MSTGKRSSPYLFVYGFLMKKNRSIPQLGVPPMPVKYIGEGYLNGKLYLVASYPGFVHCTSLPGRVYGEVYLLKEQNFFFRKMDEYELARPHFQGNVLHGNAQYKRVIRPVHIKNRSVPCWVYEYIRPTNGLKRIRSGRFFLGSGV